MKKLLVKDTVIILVMNVALIAEFLFASNLLVPSFLAKTKES